MFDFKFNLFQAHQLLMILQQVMICPTWPHGQDPIQPTSGLEKRLLLRMTSRKLTILHLMTIWDQPHQQQQQHQLQAKLLQHPQHQQPKQQLLLPNQALPVSNTPQIQLQMQILHFE